MIRSISCSASRVAGSLVTVNFHDFWTKLIFGLKNFHDVLCVECTRTSTLQIKVQFLFRENYKRSQTVFLRVRILKIRTELGLRCCNPACAVVFRAPQRLVIKFCGVSTPVILGPRIKNVLNLYSFAEKRVRNENCTFVLKRKLAPALLNLVPSGTKFRVPVRCTIELPVT